MATYCVEKFESDNDQEVKVCWRQDKHIHNASFITTIKQKLHNKYGGVWDVRVNSYQSGQQSCPMGSENYEDL